MKRWTILLLALGLILTLFLLRRRPPLPAAPAPATAQSREGRTLATSRPLRLSTGVASAIDSGPDKDACVVEGRVLSTRTGAGIARANLTFGGNGAAFAVTTDESGQFRWTIADAGVYQLTSAAAQGFLSFAPALDDSPVELTARPGVRLSGITIFLVPAVDYAAQIVDSKRRPIAGARMARLQPLEGEPDELISNAEGEARFHAPDNASFEVSHAGHKRRLVQLDLAAQVSRRLVVELADSAAGEPGPVTTSGKVVDDRKSPVDNAQVVAIEGEAAIARATTDEKGAFAISLRPGKVRLLATHKGFAPSEIEAVVAGATDVVIELKRGGRITGSVHDQDGGKPVVAFSVVATERKGALERGASITHSFFDSQGQFQLEGVRPGIYYVVAVAQGRGVSPEQRVEVTGSADGHCELALPRGARLQGRVVDRPSGAGIANARVSLENPFAADTMVPMPVVASAETNASGDFELGGLTEGTASLFAAAEKHHSRVLPGIRIGAENAQPLVIDLVPTEPGEEPQIESAGINAAVRAEGDLLVLGHCTPAGGAAAAGLQEGDYILRVDGADVRELGFAGAVSRLRGPEGTTVAVTFRRGDAVSDVAVPRRRVINR
jgi:Carboxypeptidase regulatory-like domain/PDZ domain